MVKNSNLLITLTESQLADFQNIISGVSSKMRYWLKECSQHKELSKLEFITLEIDLREFDYLFLEAKRPFSIFFIHSFKLSFEQAKNRLLSVGIIEINPLIIFLNSVITTLNKIASSNLVNENQD